MRIHNLRLGFATNSSSTHSIIFLNKPTSDHLINGGEFGWQLFTAASRESKFLYLIAQVANSFGGEMEQDVILSDWFGDSYDKLMFDENYQCSEPYVDHQSAFYFPREFGKDIISKEFLLEFKDFLLKDGVVILGGSDNDSKKHPLASRGSKINFPLSDYPFYEVCRKDEKYNYWTLYSRGNGTRVRLSFDDFAKKPEKASAPELLDVCITKHCLSNCEFCYVGATPEGKHAKLEDISRLADALAELKVFEVAIGGGEPTLHPDFLEILKIFRGVNIIPNFTTRNLDWLRKPGARSVLDTVGSFAYSVQATSDIDDLVLAVNDATGCNPDEDDYWAYEGRKPVIHLVLGTLKRKLYRSILKKASNKGITVTLLGFKSVGRGAAFNPEPYDWWLDEIKKLDKERSLPTISVDTPLADKYQEEIKAMNVSDWLFHTLEGKFSGYVDVVDGKFGPSSFCPEQELVSIDLSGKDLAGEIKEKFASF